MTREQMKVVPENVRPSDAVIDAVLDESMVGSVARQWVNWAASVLGMPEKYGPCHPMTVQSIWVFYEGCRVYKEKCCHGA